MDKLEDILGKEHLVKWNTMLEQLFKNTAGVFILQETERSFDLTFKVPLPKTNREGMKKIVEQILRFRGT